MISRERGKMDRALVFYRMTLDIGRTNPDLSAEYEHLRRALGE